MKNQILTLFVLSSVLLAEVALAQDVYPPHLFYGSVIYNGQPAPDGLLVVAKINGVEVANTTTSGGKYGYNPVFYVEGVAGNEIHFFVNGIDTGRSEPFCSGCFNDCGMYDDNCPPFDLSVVGPIIVTTTTTPGGGGGGGTTGGGTAETTTTTTISTRETQQCQERWVCSEWSACVNGIQTRTCNDVNNCGTKNKEPYTSQPCVVGEETERPQIITGFISLIVSNTIYQIMIALAVIASLFFLFRHRLRKRKR